MVIQPQPHELVPMTTMTTITEAFLDLTLWEKFDAACGEAEAARSRAVKLAIAERDQVVSHIPVWNLSAPDRIRATALARYDEKIQAAQSECEAACARARRALMEALDQVNAAHREADRIGLVPDLRSDGGADS
jgi:hypothetical protein